MRSSEFRGMVVPKPWGAERMLRSNPEIELWHLAIGPGCSTSFHCHPQKKTGLIVLSGRARIQFMNDSIELGPLGKVMLRPGLFHQTICVSDGGLELLEIETPPDKADLVRLFDPYGRAGKPYEPAGTYLKAFDHVDLDDVDVAYRVGGCSLTVRKPPDTSPGQMTPFRLVEGEAGMILGGGLYAEWPTGRAPKMVLSAGDIVNAHTFSTLADRFMADDLEVLVISRAGAEGAI